MPERWHPHVTVSAVVERDGRYLMVEERIGGRTVLNQPSGHLEEHESLIDAVVREVREETAWRFVPRHLLGVYLWRSEGGRTFLRVAFVGECAEHAPERTLDDGILRALWLDRSEVTAAQLRSPLVMRCIDDHVAGRRHPLELVAHLVGED